MAEGREIGELAHEEEDSVSRIMIPAPILKSSPDLRSLNDRESTPERQRIERNLIQTGKSSPSSPPCLRIHTGMFMSVLLRDELVKYTAGVGGSSERLGLGGG